MQQKKENGPTTIPTKTVHPCLRWSRWEVATLDNHIHSILPNCLKYRRPSIKSTASTMDTTPATATFMIPFTWVGNLAVAIVSRRVVVVEDCLVLVLSAATAVRRTLFGCRNWVEASTTGITTPFNRRDRMSWVRLLAATSLPCHTRHRWEVVIRPEATAAWTVGVVCLTVCCSNSNSNNCSNCNNNCTTTNNCEINKNIQGNPPHHRRKPLGNQKNLSKPNGSTSNATQTKTNLNRRWRWICQEPWVATHLGVEQTVVIWTQKPTEPF